MKFSSYLSLLTAIMVAPVQAAVYKVNTGIDKAMGSGSECPLRAALKNIANLSEDGLPFNVHNVDCPKGEAVNYVYFTFPAEPKGWPVVKVDPLLGPLALNANKAVLVGVTLDGQKKTGILELYGTAALRIEHATIRAGSEFPGGSGAGILVQGDASLYLDRVRMVGNLAGGEGAALAFESTGELMINSSYFGANRAPQGAGGALVIKTTTRQVMILDSTFESNSAGTGGGAIYCSSSSTPFNLEGSSVRSNEATYAFATGGALLNNCRAKVRFTGFLSNRVPNGTGGAIYNSNALVVEDASFVDNFAKDKLGLVGAGGAILDNGDLAVTRSGFHRNRASREGGAIEIDDGAANRAISITNSTFVENEAKDEQGQLNPGAAIWIADAGFQAGRDAGMRMQNLTLYHNLGSSQLYLADAGGKDQKTILLTNSLLMGDSIDAGTVDVCAGRVERLSYASGLMIANTQFPGTTCDQDVDKIPVVDLKLAGPKTGGFFDQVYVPQAGMALPVGDYAQCNGPLVFGLDQFQNKRLCRQGAVEDGPKATRNHGELPY